jgi:hypothetical protein
MQGATSGVESKWGKAADLLKSNSLDVLCLQECGKLPPSISHVPRGEEEVRRPNPVFQTNEVPNAHEYRWEVWQRSRRAPLYVYWADGGTRVSLAILTIRQPSYLLYEAPVDFGPTSESQGPRPAIGIGFENALWDTLHDIDVWTVHAKSLGGGDNDSTELLNCINTNSTGYGSGSLGACTWMSLGDYNLLPESLGDPNKIRYVICPPDGVTHPGSDKELDYMVRSPGSEEIEGVVVSEFVVSDHYPVLYDTGTSIKPPKVTGKRDRPVDDEEDDARDQEEYKRRRQEIFGSDSEEE